MSLKELSAMLRKHFKGYQEEPGSFRKIGNFLSHPEYRFDSRRLNTGMVYLVKFKER